ncbi:hypothetical protein ACJO2E_08550 [Marinobacter sp. M1N3S26]|uniref:head-tail joining protein n=1 Tax=Marinobacter sp. M1N3S26 TaxID=3382299 RepID=UPI00387B7738
MSRSLFDETADSLESAVDCAFAVDAVYADSNGGVFEIRCIVDRDVEQREAYDTNLPVRRHEIEIRKCYICNPRRGHRVRVGDTTWILDGLIYDDGHVTRHHANVCKD